MRALFVGHTYIDVTVIADSMPEGDDKQVAHDYAVSFGGNAVTAAFTCAKLGVPVELITTLADDWLGHMFSHMCSTYGVRLRGRKVNRSSLSFILPRGNRRAILRARDEAFTEDFPRLDVGAFDALHLDGHQADAALHYARAFRERGLLTSLDGGGVRSNTSEVMSHIDVAVVAERLCEQMEMSEEGMLGWLREKGCKIGGVTSGEKGMLWYDEAKTLSRLPALPIPPEKSATHPARATCSTAPISPPACFIRTGRGSSISASRAPPPRTRSSMLATKPGFPRSATSSASWRRHDAAISPCPSDAAGRRRASRPCSVEFHT